MTRLKKTNYTPSWWGPKLRRIFLREPEVRKDFSGTIIKMDSTETDFSTEE